MQVIYVAPKAIKNQSRDEWFASRRKTLIYMVINCSRRSIRFSWAGHDWLV